MTVNSLIVVNQTTDAGCYFDSEEQKSMRNWPAMNSVKEEREGEERDDHER